MTAEKLAHHYAALTKYTAAKRALAEAHSVDEVKVIRDKAAAMRMYAMQAKDRVLIDQATEIRLRAERRAGELLKEMEKNKGSRGAGRPRKGGHTEQPPKEDLAPKLSDLNINKSQSSRWQKLAAMPEEDFEQVVMHAQQKACAVVDRAHQPKPTPPRSKFKNKPATRDTADVAANCVSEVELIVRAAITKIRDREVRAGLAEQLSRALGAIFTEALKIDEGCIDQAAGTAPDPGEAGANRWVNVP
jgi:hypothetical protein